MRKFEYFPIRCRVNRAMELYKKCNPKSAISGIQSEISSECAQTEVKKHLKSKVGVMNNRAITTDMIV
jgi:hypothetical protein